MTQKFLTLSVLLILSRCYDVYTTYLYIPDLHDESNILVQYFGAGWSVVLTIQIILVLLLIVCLYYSIFKFKRQQPAVSGLNLKQYISFLHFGDTTSFNKIFYTLPLKRNILLPALAYIATNTLIVTGFIVGSSTLLLILSNTYRSIYGLGIPYLLYGLIVVFAAYFSYRFYNNEFRAYQNSYGTTPNPVQSEDQL